MWNDVRSSTRDYKIGKEQVSWYKLGIRHAHTHEPTRQRERQMRRFKSAGQAQRFLTVHGVVGNLFRLGRHLTRAIHYREFRSRALCEWHEVTCAENMA
jgi:transposase-like protein